MWSKPASRWSGATGGEQLERLFWKDVQAESWTEVDRHVASTFAGAGPAGNMDRGAFLRHLQQAPLTQVSLAECQTQMNGSDVMVTCLLRAQWGSRPSSSSTLSVWQRLNKGWVMVAHSESALAASGL